MSEKTYSVDVVVPTYRVKFDFLKDICALRVPKSFQTCFYIVVDNPNLLINMMLGEKASAIESHDERVNKAALALESALREATRSIDNNHAGNTVRVLGNPKNLGPSGSRNRGLDESSAEYILFLDDDIKPKPDLLDKYAEEVPKLTNDEAGLVGVVRLPRSSKMEVKHAAILMCEIASIFENAANSLYEYPAWGVTAHLLVRRSDIRFDHYYDKFGGAEDVDYCLRHCKETKARFKAAPSAVVFHPYWDGSFLDIAYHFFKWAYGNSVLFARHPEHTYRSFPNAVEIFLFLFPIQLMMGVNFASIIMTPVWFLLAAALVDISAVPEFRYRCAILEYEQSSLFLIAGHILANFYLFVFDSGRLWGHFRQHQLQHMFRRFDAHYDILMNTRKSFHQCEMMKFVLYAGIAVSTLRSGGKFAA